MNEFIEIPVTKRSLSLRKPIYGVGINDSNYQTQPTINGKRSICPFYSRWRVMIQRCYDPRELARHPSYSECSVCDEWLTFSNFRAWMQSQEWEGLSLDKDILIQGNNIYRPKACIFVSQQINTLLIYRKSKSSKTRAGVSFRDDERCYVAEVRFNGKSNYIGRYTTENLAFQAYKKIKYEIIHDIAILQKEPLRSALLRWKIS